MLHSAPSQAWPVLIVDDDESVLTLSSLMLSSVKVDGRPLRLELCRSAAPQTSRCSTPTPPGPSTAPNSSPAAATPPSTACHSPPESAEQLLAEKFAISPRKRHSTLPDDGAAGDES